MKPAAMLKEGRLLLVAAHPDDETIGAGGLLALAGNPILLHVTDGAPRDLGDARTAGFETREQYRDARRRELRGALEIAGIPQSRARTLDCVDQESSLNMAYLALRIDAVLRELRPICVLTHAYEGGHPDHDATAFAVRAACAMQPSPPLLFEFPLYHAADAGLPKMETCRFLPGQDEGEAVELDAEARERKQRMIECFATQLHMLYHFPPEVEHFRRASPCDFTEPPHQGSLYYEHFNWGMKGTRWRDLAGAAAHELGMRTVL